MKSWIHSPTPRRQTKEHLFPLESVFHKDTVIFHFVNLFCFRFDLKIMFTFSLSTLLLLSQKSSDLGWVDDAGLSSW